MKETPIKVNICSFNGIFPGNRPLDIGYLEAEMGRLGFSFPNNITQIAPKNLQRFVRRQSRGRSFS